MRDPAPVLLYLHVPKAAGTTLASLLFEQIQSRSARETRIRGFHSGVYYHPATFVRDLDPDSDSLVREVLGRDDLRAVVGHFRFGLHQALARPYRYLTVLREPVSRVRSLYHFQRLNESRYGALAGVRLPDDVDLAQYVSHPPYAEVDNGMTRRISGSQPPIGQCTEAMLVQARANLQEHFSVVGLAERFDETLILLTRGLGWGEVPLYYPKNVNTHGAESADCDPDVTRMIETNNALDIELYHFAVELFNRSVDRMGEEFPRHLRDYAARQHAWYEKHCIAPPHRPA